MDKNLFYKYRSINKYISWQRDEGRCVLCGVVAVEGDHVFGRGSRQNLLKEHWMLRMTLCSMCHHRKHHGTGFDRNTQTACLKLANDSIQDLELLVHSSTRALFSHPRNKVSREDFITLITQISEDMPNAVKFIEEKING